MMPILAVFGEFLLPAPVRVVGPELAAPSELTFQFPEDRLEAEDAVSWDNPAGKLGFKLRCDHHWIAFGPDGAQDFTGFFGQLAVRIIVRVRGVEQRPAQYVGVEEDEREHG
jgi:hypothetical protein